MTRVFVTGSTMGFGYAAARQLLDDGHAVVLHPRNAERVGNVTDLVDRAAGAVIGYLARLVYLSSSHLTQAGGR